MRWTILRYLLKWQVENEQRKWYHATSNEMPTFVVMTKLMHCHDYFSKLFIEYKMVYDIKSIIADKTNGMN